MDVVMLPLVWPQMEVRFALDLLRQRERAGVVMQNFDDTYRLYYAGDLLRARARGVATVGEMAGGHPVLLLDLNKAQTFGIDLVRPSRAADAYEKMLVANERQYALAGESADTVMIVTLHETQVMALTSTGGYECNGSPTHYFPEPRVNAGDPCPMYPECSTSDGTRPVIRPA